MVICDRQCYREAKDLLTRPDRTYDVFSGMALVNK